MNAFKRLSKERPNPQASPQLKLIDRIKVFIYILFFSTLKPLKWTHIYQMYTTFTFVEISIKTTRCVCGQQLKHTSRVPNIFL